MAGLTRALPAPLQYRVPLGSRFSILLFLGCWSRLGSLLVNLGRVVCKEKVGVRREEDATDESLADDVAFSSSGVRASFSGS